MGLPQSSTTYEDALQAGHAAVTSTTTTLADNVAVSDVTVGADSTVVYDIPVITSTTTTATTATHAEPQLSDVSESTPSSGLLGRAGEGSPDTDLTANDGLLTLETFMKSAAQAVAALKTTLAAADGAVSALENQMTNFRQLRFVCSQPVF
jgi:hypothetical protein